MLANTRLSYGAVTKAFHWTVAIGILAMIPLGIVANRAAHAIEAGDLSQVDLARLLFSIHKTLGIVILGAALARIAWAISQPKPAPIHPDRRAETFLAAVVHWLLYGSLVAVPLMGWAAHAATEGFAPIWWPLGQDLPFVPESADAEHLFAALHIVFERVLVLSILLHVAGALKHHLWDRDDTLRRMLPGRTEAGVEGAAHASRGPLVAALAVWTVALGIGGALGLYGTERAVAAAPALEAVASDWTVEEGTLAIRVTQFGSDVEGSFADWTAAISYDETPDADGVHGEVDVAVAIGSLTLGSVSTQALGAAYFDAGAFPEARVRGVIREGNVLDGTLTLKGAEVPIEMPFDLTVEGDRAMMAGKLTLDRRDFGIGSDPDDGGVGDAVDVSVSLTARRSE